MTVKIEDINKSSEPLVEYAKTLGIKDYQLPSEEGLTVLDYVFGEQKTFPIADKLSAALAKSYFSTKISDSADKEPILTLIEDKLQELGVEDPDTVIADAVKASETPEEPEQKVSDNVEPGAATATFDADAVAEKLAVAIADKLQDIIAGNANNYLSSQNKVLRQELANKTIELVKVQDALKESVVTQISALEKISDSAKIEELKSRSLDSLSDKLKDLQAANVEVPAEKVSDSAETETKEPLEPGSVKIEDSAGETITEEGATEVKIEDGLVFASKEEARKEFLSVLNKKGAAAAKAFAAKVKIKGES